MAFLYIKGYDLLILTHVSVKTNIQKTYTKDMIEYGFNKAIELGYKAVIVEMNPQNYKSRDNKKDK